MKRYVISGDLIPDDDGFLIEYSTMVKVLRLAMLRRDEQYKDLENTLKNNWIYKVDKEIKNWKYFIYWAVGIALLFIII